MSLLSWLADKIGIAYEDTEGSRAGKYGRYEVYAIKLPSSKPTMFSDGSWSPALTDSGVFYVGSGVYTVRREQHLKDARRKVSGTRGQRMAMSYKEKILIWAEDHAVPIEYVTLWRTDNREEAYCVEQYWIEHYGIEKLTNMTYGHCNKFKASQVKLDNKPCRGCGTTLISGKNISWQSYEHREYLCISCKALQNKGYYKDHQEISREDVKKRQVSLRESGMCRECGKLAAEKGRGGRCAACADKNNRRVRKHTNELIAQGLCRSGCGRSLVSGRGGWCDICADKKLAAQRAKTRLERIAQYEHEREAVAAIHTQRQMDKIWRD